MQIVTVTPIDKGLPSEELTYFSKASVQPGALVLVPIRKKETLALVTAVETASEAKAKLKTSDFSLKKISRLVHPALFTPAFTAGAKAAADFYTIPLGQAIKFATPKVILDALLDTTWPAPATPSPNQLKSAAPNLKLIEKQALQDNLDERISFYRSLTRESFAQKESLLVLVPTALEAEKFYPELARGIEQYTLVLHNKLPSAEIIKIWHQALVDDHPILIIATPLFLSLPKRNIKTIIIEKEASDWYRPMARPYIDPRTLAEFYATAGSAKLIFGDTALRVDTIYRVEDRQINPAAPIKYRPYAEVPTEVLDLKKATPDLDPEREFKLLDKSALDLLSFALHRRQSVFMLVGRRGLAPLTVCNDCNFIARCPTCNTPLVLHEDSKRQRSFICHSCQARLENMDRCVNCSGWRLAPLGIGTETVAQAIEGVAGNASVSIIDSDHTPTPAKAIKSIAAFYQTPGSILIGTEMALNYLTEKIPHTIVVSLDSFFSLPGFRMREKVLRLLLSTKELTGNQMIIQTRLADDNLFAEVAKANILGFYREEIKNRELAAYPPFSILLKITRTGSQLQVEKDMNRLARLLESYQPIVFPAFNATTRGKYTAHCLIKLPRLKWPDRNLQEVLRALPTAFIVEIDPADII
ncbi:MAG: hypothetical protein A2589_01455 [Candidatus Vogelbacteria bacterium RIFOXYD1_FULL_46_19]|uniref:Primosomal protein N' 3' DNA-binding domain-containing protein n=1 Tax=Candidatus Vogelbacteria bacterium RIFOXYD1_FULL_46_19 TaxID=1802439 RepID=A0A1G2QHQ2_9BACT|nr:MAG: hypothetical protein A2589_01455 [Candidatus Vogelbacteria bacterium RIFOXYD1_FULL_46_19]